MTNTTASTLSTRAAQLGVLVRVVAARRHLACRAGQGEVTQVDGFDLDAPAAAGPLCDVVADPPGGPEVTMPMRGSTPASSHLASRQGLIGPAGRCSATNLPDVSGYGEREVSSTSAASASPAMRLITDESASVVASPMSRPSATSLSKAAHDLAGAAARARSRTSAAWRSGRSRGPRGCAAPAPWRRPSVASPRRTKAHTARPVVSSDAPTTGARPPPGATPAPTRSRPSTGGGRRRSCTSSTRPSSQMLLLRRIGAVAGEVVLLAEAVQ